MPPGPGPGPPPPAEVDMLYLMAVEAGGKQSGCQRRARPNSNSLTPPFPLSPHLSPTEFTAQLAGHCICSLSVSWKRGAQQATGATNQNPLSGGGRLAPAIHGAARCRRGVALEARKRGRREREQRGLRSLPSTGRKLTNSTVHHQNVAASTTLLAAP